MSLNRELVVLYCFSHTPLSLQAWSSGRVQYFPFIYCDTMPRPTPLQDVAPLLKMMSTPQAPSATPVRQSYLQSSPVFTPTQPLSTPSQLPQSSYLQPTPLLQSPYSSSPLQSPYSSSPLQSPYSASPLQSPYTSNAQSPSMMPQQLSFYSPGNYVSTPQQNSTPQHSFQLSSSPFTPLSSVLRSPQQTSTPQQQW